MGVACATFGLVLGGLIGGPVARYLLRKVAKPGAALVDDDPLNFEQPQAVRLITATALIETLALILVCLTAGQALTGGGPSVCGPVTSCSLGSAAMSIFRAVVLGIVQGLTEFLPISSSGHLRIVPALLGWSDPGTAFTAVIQLGTMAAVVIYFWKDLWRITLAWFASLRDRSRRSDPDARMGWYLIVATIPIGILGLAFKDPIENEFRTLELIGATLIIMGLVLGRAETAGAQERGVETISPKDAAIIGIAQAVALVLSLALTMVPVVGGFVRSVREAQDARGVRLGLRTALPILVRTMRHADEVGEALAARGLAS